MKLSSLREVTVKEHTQLDWKTVRNRIGRNWKWGGLRA
jgi:hypothetical protein